MFVGNHALQIPLVQWLGDQSLYSNDYFTTSLPYYCSMLWRVVAYLGKFTAIDNIFVYGFFFERILLVYSAGRLAYCFFPSSRLAIVGAMALSSLKVHSIIGGGTISTDCFEQTGLFIPFFLLSVAAFYEQRKILWAIYLAIGFNLNSMYGAYALTYFTTAFILTKEWRTRWLEWIKPVVIFTALSSPAIFYTVQAFGKDTFSSELWIGASKYLLSCHLYPLTWNFASFVKYFLLIVFSLLILTKKIISLFEQGLIWTLVNICWVVLSFIAAYVIVSPSLLVLHPARATDLWCVFISIALVASFGEEFEKGDQPRWWSALGFSLSIVFLAVLSDIQFTALLMVVAICLLAIPWFRDKIYMGHRISLLLLVLVMTMGVWEIKERGWTVRNKPDTNIVELASWAKQNTDKGAVFLVNPTWQDFREISQRNVFVTLKDGSALLWYRPYVDEWAKRLSYLGISVLDEKPLHWTNKSAVYYNNKYLAFDDTSISRITENRYRLDYWIVPAVMKTKHRIVYQNRNYKILSLQV
jgi:hypothetical protein